MGTPESNNFSVSKWKETCHAAILEKSEVHFVLTNLKIHGGTYNTGIYTALNNKSTCTK